MVHCCHNQKVPRRGESWTAFFLVKVSGHKLESSQTQVFVWFSALTFPFHKMLFMKRLKFSCFAHCNENPTYVFLFWEWRGLSPNFHIHVSVRDLYSPRIGLHISSSRIGRPIVEIYKSVKDAWMWKLGLRPWYSFSGNICFEISVFCLCSADCFVGIFKIRQGATSFMVVGYNQWFH